MSTNHRSRAANLSVFSSKASLNEEDMKNWWILMGAERKLTGLRTRSETKIESENTKPERQINNSRKINEFRNSRLASAKMRSVSSFAV
jgi:hypothetical protein